MIDVNSFTKEADGIDQILLKYKKTGEKFVDNNFHPKKNIYEKYPNLLHGVSWQRIDSMLKSPLYENVYADSICQGILGDCYLLSALSRLCMQPELVRAIFDPRSSIEAGAVIVYFYTSKRKVPVLIDTFVPFKRGTRTPVFAHPKNTTDSYWFVLVEKAYSKLFGSYSSIIAGNLNKAVYNIFGYLPDNLRTDQFNEDILFNRMKKWTSKGCIIGSSIKVYVNSKITHDDVVDNGLVTNHSYLIMRVKEAEGKRFIQLRNPWGEHEWLGDYSYCSDLWTEPLKEQLHFYDADDGSFWMLMSDFKKFFSELDVSKPVKSTYYSQSKIVNFVQGQNSPNTPTFNIMCSKPCTIRIFIEKLCADGATINVRNDYGPGIVNFSSPNTIVVFNTKKYGKSRRYNIKVFTTSTISNNAKIFVRFIAKEDFKVTMQGDELKRDENIEANALKKVKKLRMSPRRHNRFSSIAPLV